MQILLERILLIANRAFDYILLMFMLLIGSLGIYFIWDASLIYSCSNSSQYKQYKPSVEENQSFEALREINPDVKAWLTIDGTKIDYPIVQAEDNIFYLTRDAEKNSSSAGSLFIDSKCNSYFNDFNTIIYGHHMAYGSMFGDLDKFCERTFFDEHASGSLFFNNEKWNIKFFAFIDKANGYDNTIYSCDIRDGDSRQSYLEYLEEQARYFRNIGVSTNDRIVLLSTCSYTMTNGRYILVGKLVRPENALADNMDVGRTWRDWVKDFFAVVPIAIWLLILLLILLLWIVLYKRKKMIKRR